MRLLALVCAAIVGTFALGCVITTHHTIEAHIVVDIRHIEKQADDVLDFVEGKKDTLPQPTPAPEVKPQKSSWLRDALDALNPCPAAYAAELKSSSPKIAAIATKMKERYAALQDLKQKGCVGENNDGYVDLRSSEGLADAKAKNEAQKVVAAENADRKDLYREVAELNSAENVNVSTVERIYAQKRLLRAAAGEIFQLPPAGDDFEAFKKSASGQRLGSECVPNAWVAIK